MGTSLKSRIPKAVRQSVELSTGHEGNARCMCTICGQGWQVMATGWKPMPRGWWKCPNRCYEQA